MALLALAGPPSTRPGMLHVPPLRVPVVLAVEEGRRVRRLFDTARPLRGAVHRHRHGHVAVRRDRQEPGRRAHHDARRPRARPPTAEVVVQAPNRVQVRLQGSRSALAPLTPDVLDASLDLAGPRPGRAPRAGSTSRPRRRRPRRRAHAGRGARRAGRADAGAAAGGGQPDRDAAAGHHARRRAHRARTRHDQRSGGAGPGGAPRGRHRGHRASPPAAAQLRADPPARRQRAGGARLSSWTRRSSR